MKAIRRALRNILRPYRVTICDPEGHVYIHRAWTTDDARDWIDCYPRTHINVIRTRMGRIVR